MRANGFTDTDGLLAIDTANRTFAFLPTGRYDQRQQRNSRGREFIRKDRISPAVRNDEWARAAVGAANGLETAGG